MKKFANLSMEGVGSFMRRHPYTHYSQFEITKNKIKSTERGPIGSTLLNQKMQLFFTCVLMNYDKFLAYPEFFPLLNAKF